MKIEVEYFASIREATGLTHETVTLNAGASATPTVDSLRTLLAQPFDTCTLKLSGSKTETQAGSFHCPPGRPSKPAG